MHIPLPLRAFVVASTLGACAPDGDAAPPATDPLAALSADSAVIVDELRLLSADDMEGRGTGTPGAALALAFLEARFGEAGLEPVGEGFTHPFSWSRGAAGPRAGANLVGQRPGAERPGRVIVVSGHYDHEGVRNGEIFNGADDNASGAVGLVALARALRGVPLRHTVVFAAFDAEEVGLRGAREFVAQPPVPLDSIVLNINMDMVARTGGILWAAGAHHTPALRPILESVATRAPLDLRLGHDSPAGSPRDDWTSQSDHGAFHEAGIPFVYLGVDDHPDYHRPTDDFERVVPGEYMNALRTALMVLLAMDQALQPTGS
jgi:hypothetical protein